jgi:hypothetical protein
MIRSVGALLALGWLAGCAVDPVRLPLPAPFALTSGGTVVPGNGVSLSAELADALRGPELVRGETLGAGLAGGAGDRISVGVVTLRTDDDLGPDLDRSVGVGVARFKAQAGHPFGNRSALAVHGSVGWASRTDDSLQDDRLHSVDLGANLEWLLTPDPAAGARISAYGGPRVLFTRYVDRLRPGFSFRTAFAGVLGGLHLSLSSLEIFGEATVLHVPRLNVGGAATGGRVTVMPALGLVLRFGPRFRWPATGS